MPLYNPSATVTDATISTSDITTNNSSTAKHGFLKKLDNSATHFMDGTGAWTTPSGTGAVASDTIWDAAGDLALGSGADTAAKLTKGADGTYLGVASGAVAWQTVGAYTAYTPALTGSSVNPTLGSGSSATGRWTQFGKQVSVDGRIIFGSSGVAAGTGTYYISLPVTATSSADRSLGYGHLYDDSAATFKVAIYFFEDTGKVRIVNENVASSLLVTSAAPWTWAANDYLAFHFDYEAA